MDGNRGKRTDSGTNDKALARRVASQLNDIWNRSQGIGSSRSDQWDQHQSSPDDLQRVMEISQQEYQARRQQEAQQEAQKKVLTKLRSSRLQSSSIFESVLNNVDSEKYTDDDSKKFMDTLAENNFIGRRIFTKDDDDANSNRLFTLREWIKDPSDSGEGLLRREFASSALDKLGLPADFTDTVAANADRLRTQIEEWKGRQS